MHLSVSDALVSDAVSDAHLSVSDALSDALVG